VDSRSAVGLLYLGNEKFSPEYLLIGWVILYANLIGITVAFNKSIVRFSLVILTVYAERVTEVMKRIATSMVGGMASATVPTLVVVPGYLRTVEGDWPAGEATGTSGQ
jgi:hypothetical protein